MFALFSMAVYEMRALRASKHGFSMPTLMNAYDKSTRNIRPTRLASAISSPPSSSAFSSSSSPTVQVAKPLEHVLLVLTMKNELLGAYLSHQIMPMVRCALCLQSN